MKIFQYKGLTLIELMFALLLSCFCMAVLTKTYLATHRHQRFIQAVNTFQDDVRIAIFFLQTAIHSAGYTGCGFLSEEIMIIPKDNIVLNQYNRISTYQTKEMKPNSEGFSVTHTSFAKNQLQEKMVQSNQLIVSTDVTFAVNDAIVINDCVHAEIFIIQNILNQGNRQILMSAPLHYLYKKNTELSRLEFNAFYVGKTERTQPDGSPLYALYSKDNAGRKQELVANISEMKILFSEHTGFLLQEKKWQNIADWSQVKGVDIQLTVDNPHLHKSISLYAALSV